ncbi:MAG: AbrB/MazE/SpoVT family DNA-binding domain-containing protein [Sulfolobales archaeon]
MGSLLRRTRVGNGGVTTVPHEVRKILDVKEGDALEWIYENGKILVRKVGSSD